MKLRKIKNHSTSTSETGESVCISMQYFFDAVRSQTSSKNIYRDNQKKIKNS